MAQVDFAAKFPSMKPVGKAPSMHLINGIGTRVVGARDHDRETDSYIATLCFCVLYIPLIPIRAYRVIKSPRGGWYFLGTEPLSAFAKAWNLFLLLAIITTGVTIGLTAYTSRPEYIARKRMAEAQTLATQGHLAQAATIYGQFIRGRGLESANANEALKDLIDTRCTTAPGNEAAGVFAAAARLTADAQAYTSADLIDRGLKIAGELAADNVKGALALLDVLRTLTLDPREINKSRLPLLEKWVAAEPANMEPAIALASLLEDENQFDKALKLLLPFKDKLGTGEGARVLGLLYVHEDKLDDAYALLFPYVKPRLDALHAAEKNEEQTVNAAWDREIQLLRNEKAPPAFYEGLNAAPKDKHDDIIRTYVQGRLKDDPQIRAVQESLEKETQVVPVVLELGIVMLQRAEATPDLVERKKRFEATQDMFLSIQSAAGESDEYRLFLGQVYFWLGKQTEGKDLFEKFLASKGRSPQSLLQIGATLRSVGVDSDARAMAEESYAKATTSAQRYDAAHLRSLIEKDIDDEIEWLKRCNPQDASITVTLATTLGNKAQQDGRDDEAATQFRAALEACNALPRNDLTFNQISLASHALYRVTGDPKDLARAVDAIQQAVNLSQSDSVLMYNAGMTVLQASLTDVIGKDLDLHALHASADTQILDYLYHDEAGRTALAKQLAAHAGIAKANAYFDKVMVVSPKGLRGYLSAFEIQAMLMSDPGLRAIEQHLKTADIDLTDEVREMKDFLAGTRDAQNTQSQAAALKRLQAATTQIRPLGGPTLAMALDMQVHLLIQGDLFQGAADPDKILDLATEAYKVAPSSATHGTLITALEFRAYKQLRKSDPAFEQFAKTYYRSVGHSRILAFLVQQNGALGKAVLAHPDFQHALALMKENLTLFPTNASGLQWAAFSVSDPASAQKIAANFRNVPRHALIQSITSSLAPASAAEALDSAWMALALGKPQEAQAILAKTAALGIPVPQLR